MAHWQRQISGQVIQPGWGGGDGGPRDLEGRNPEDLEGHCFYTTYDGACYPSYNHWEGRQNATELGDRIGLLLDLDQGSMTVYKNDERLGVMATGLSGEQKLGGVAAHHGQQRTHRCHCASGLAHSGRASAGSSVSSRAR